MEELPAIILNRNFRPLEIIADRERRRFRFLRRVGASKLEYHTLRFAIMQKGGREEDIKLYLEQGAGKDFEGPEGESLLCFAFKHYYSNNVLQLLVDGGCLPSKCDWHDHELFCALSCPSVGKFDEDFLRLLIQRVDNINTVSFKAETIFQSPLCLALRRGAPASVVKLLLEAGCILGCVTHDSPLLCATSGFGFVREEDYPDLKADIVQMLLHKGADITVLKEALVHCKYETEAVELLLDSLKGKDLKAFKKRKTHDSLLHLAVSNPHVRLDVVKLLINRVGIKVGKMNKNKDTILHEIMKNRFSGYEDDDKSSGNKGYMDDSDDEEDIKVEKDSHIQLYSVVEFLLESGARVNVLNSSDKTPIHVGVDRLHSNDHKRMLFADDPIFGIDTILLLEDFYGGGNFDGIGLPVFYDFLEKGLKCCTMLLKHYLLEIPNSVFQSWIQGEGDKETFMERGAKWIRELQKLDTKIVGQDRTLREYLGAGPVLQTAKRKLKAEGVAFNQLLRTMTENDFPLFVDVIATLLPRPAMEMKLEDLKVNVVKGAEEKLLTRIIVCRIGKHLTKQDLLRFILAFYKPDNQPCDKRDSKVNLLKDYMPNMETKLGNKLPFHKSNGQACAGESSKVVSLLGDDVGGVETKPCTKHPFFKTDDLACVQLLKNDGTGLEIKTSNLVSILSKQPFDKTNNQTCAIETSAVNLLQDNKTGSLVTILSKRPLYKTNDQSCVSENSKVKLIENNSTGLESKPATFVPFYKTNNQACVAENSAVNLLKNNRAGMDLKTGNLVSILSKRPLCKTNDQARAGEYSKVKTLEDNRTVLESKPATLVPFYKTNINNQACAGETSAVNLLKDKRAGMDLNMGNHVSILSKHPFLTNDQACAGENSKRKLLEDHQTDMESKLGNKRPNLVFIKNCN